jgi:hypothetical protein
MIQKEEASSATDSVTDLTDLTDLTEVRNNCKRYYIP